MDEFDWSILSVPTPRAVVRGQLEFSWWELAAAARDRHAGRVPLGARPRCAQRPAPRGVDRAADVRRRRVGGRVARAGADHPGPRTIAWLVAHLTEVLSRALRLDLRGPRGPADTLTYSGEVGPAVAELTRVVDLWRAGIAGMSDDDIFTVGFSQATEIDQQAPFAHLVAARQPRDHPPRVGDLHAHRPVPRARRRPCLRTTSPARPSRSRPSAETVWDTLVDPEATWMMGARVTSTYVVGVPITFDGEWDGKPFQDHGEILEVDRPRRLRYTPLVAAERAAGRARELPPPDLHVRGARRLDRP